MTALELIEQKRAEAAQQSTAGALEQRNLQAITDSSRLIAGTIAREADTSRKSVQLVEVKNDNLAQREDIHELTQHVTLLVEQTTAKHQAWDGVVDTLQSTLSSTIKAVGQLDDHVTTKNAEVFLQSVGELKQALDNISTLRLESDDKMRGGLQSILEAIRGQVVAPVVKVPAPKVTIQERAIDFTPLQDTIREAMTPVLADNDPIDLSDYRASDIKESGKNLQYIGFVHPSGKWYIMENNMATNAIRYLFGTKDYTTYYKKAATYEYQLLDEAYNATI